MFLLLKARAGKNGASCLCSTFAFVVAFLVSFFERGGLVDKGEDAEDDHDVREVGQIESMWLDVDPLE